jgi:tetratricopeptide (TPR) repeat protein
MAKKLTKKELREPDEFQTFTMRFLGYVSEHRKQFYLAGIVFLVAIVAAGGYAFYEKRYEAKAAERYAAAADTSPTGQGQANPQALQMYEDLIRLYPRSAVAPLARYHMGNLLYEKGEYGRAVEEYEKFIALSGAKNVLLVSLAYYGVGYCYEDRKEYPKALEAYERAAEKSGDTAFRAIMERNLGRICEAMGDTEKAREHYEKALSKPGDPLMERYIRTILAGMGKSTERSAKKGS